MAKREPTTKERTCFALEKSLSAGKWIVLSGTLTFFLGQLINVVGEFKLPSWAILLIYSVVNTVSFAVAKYMEGQE